VNCCHYCASAQTYEMLETQHSGQESNSFIFITCLTRGSCSHVERKVSAHAWCTWKSYSSLWV